MSQQNLVQVIQFEILLLKFDQTLPFFFQALQVSRLIFQLDNLKPLFFRFEALKSAFGHHRLGNESDSRAEDIMNVHGEHRSSITGSCPTACIYTKI